MSTVRKSLEQIRREGGGQVDRARLDAFTEADIERMAEEDDTLLSDDELEQVQVVHPAKKQKAAM